MSRFCQDPRARRDDHRVEHKATAAERSDHEPSLDPRGIRLAVAGGAQRDQLIQIEIGATLGSLDHMMDIEPLAPPAGLAAPPGAAPHFGADDLPSLARCAIPPRTRSSVAPARLLPVVA
jgi:hypothetical protein